MTEMSGEPGDFSMEQFLPPTDEARAAFGEVLTQLDPLAKVSYLQGLDVTLSKPGVNMTVACWQSQVRYPETGRMVDIGMTLLLQVELGTERFVASDQTDIFKLREAVNMLTQGEEPGVRDWIEGLAVASTFARTGIEVADRDMVRGLLAESPAPVSEATTYQIQTYFKNGTLIEGEWTVANDEFLRRCRERQPAFQLCLLEVKTADGGLYSYDAHASGDAILLIKYLDAWRHDNSTDVTSGDDIPLVMDAMSIDLHERQTAHTLGVDTITEKSLDGFTRVISEAMASGVQLNMSAA